jgi:23S rRNA A2030 N6-methylase RlmJ
MRTETHILAVAMHALAGEIVSEDGVASAAIREAGDRLLEQSEEIKSAQEELSSIHRWIERNHPDGVIDSQAYSQNLERVTDRWYDRLDKVERERDGARELAKAFHDDQARLILEMKGWREQAAELAVALLSPNSDYSRAVLQKYQERIEK